MTGRATILFRMLYTVFIASLFLYIGTSFLTPWLEPQLHKMLTGQVRRWDKVVHVGGSVLTTFFGFMYFLGGLFMLFGPLQKGAVVILSIPLVTATVIDYQLNEPLSQNCFLLFAISAVWPLSNFQLDLMQAPLNAAQAAAETAKSLSDGAGAKTKAKDDSKVKTN